MGIHQMQPLSPACHQPSISPQLPSKHAKTPLIRLHSTSAIATCRIGHTPACDQATRPVKAILHRSETAALAKEQLSPPSQTAQPRLSRAAARVLPIYPPGRIRRFISTYREKAAMCHWKEEMDRRKTITKGARKNPPLNGKIQRGTLMGPILKREPVVSV